MDKLSIVIPVLNSHEVLRRQFLHFENIGIPEGVEIIIVDDGSEPPLKYDGKLPVRIIYTNDKRPWTWALARNRGAREARGEYLLMFDLDIIMTKEALDLAYSFGGLRLAFRREFGVLLEDGSLTQDRDVLESYGLPKESTIRIRHHPNNFCMKKTLFWELGGYREDLIGREYPQGEDNGFFKKMKRWMRANNKTSYETCPLVYMFPNGQYCGDVDFNPFNLFHLTSRKTKRNPFHKKI